MTQNRRDFLAACATLGAAGLVRAAPDIATSAPRLLPRPEGRRRVVIVGGGWGGLSAARHLREQAPDLEVVLLERNAAFWSCPLSNKWLANLVDARYLAHDYAAAAKAYGYTFIRTHVQAVDRDRRRVVTADGTIDYDWLILAAGIRQDYPAWLGDDRRAAERVRQHYPAVYAAGDDFAALKRKLDGFAGGDLVMTIPPLPYRCPPAPYERAALIGWLLKTRRIKGRLIVLDPNPIAPAFRRVFEERYRDQIAYRQDMRVESVDPFERKIRTEFDEIRFDDAILIAPQQAADIVWQADLIGRDGTGRPTGWADVDPIHLHARNDERIFVIGDAIGPVSPLFGHYPKSGHMASRQGRIVAREIAARARGNEPPSLLPESVCYLFTDFEPLSMVRIDASYRIRGDGLIDQKVRQIHDPNPRDEDLAWATAAFSEFLAFQG
jgi:NADPH-dependent 2,4-dienoyl-CoA reductase/sulfur reductase-like enzyme